MVFLKKSDLFTIFRKFGYYLGAVHIIRHAFFICLKRDKNKIVVKLTTTKLHKQKKSRVTYYLNSPIYYVININITINIVSIMLLMFHVTFILHYIMHYINMCINTCIHINVHTGSCTYFAHPRFGTIASYHLASWLSFVKCLVQG